MAEVSTPVQQLAVNNLQFSLDLLKKAADGNNNILISPFSIGVAFAMILGGARNQTAQEMKKVMKLDSFDNDSVIHDAFHDVIQSIAKHEGVTLLTANRLYLQEKYDIVSAFQSLLEMSYQSDLSLVDFANNSKRVEKLINEWVEKLTNNKIQELLPPDSLDPTIRLVLINAVYFKGDWAKKFDSSSTKPGNFHLNSTEKVTVDMMHMNSKFSIGMSQNFQILEMRYVGQNLSMYIILPNEVNGIEDLQSRLNAEMISQLMESMWSTDVELAIPKFKMESTLSLSGILTEMGMSSLFNPKANLSGISLSEALYVSGAYHKTFLEVNEEGTEAAAATALKIRPECYIEPATFIANHPFMLMIRDKTSGIILFLGKVTNPS